MTLRSLAANTPSRRANWRALGLSLEDMEKPKIAVVNSLERAGDLLRPPRRHRQDREGRDPRRRRRAVRGAHRRAVATSSPARNKAGSYILAGRDIIANDIEVAGRGGAARRDDLPDELRQDPAGPPDGRRAGSTSRRSWSSAATSRRARSTASRSTSRTCGRAPIGDALRRASRSSRRRDGRERDHGPGRVRRAWPPPTRCTRRSRRSACACPATRRCAPTARRCRPTPARRRGGSSRWSTRT